MPRSAAVSHTLPASTANYARVWSAGRVDFLGRLQGLHSEVACGDLDLAESLAGLRDPSPGEIAELQRALGTPGAL